MEFKEVGEKFKVSTIENGKKDENGDRLYVYKIMTNELKESVLQFCTEDLKPSFIKEDKPNVLSPELIEFKLLTQYGNTFMYSYKVKVSKMS
jgi:hypothetical protein